MQRRMFIAYLGSAAAWPLVARAQQSERIPRIGVLLGSYTESDKAGQARIAVFLKTLAELGWNADRNIRIDYRWGAGDTDQARKLTLETVQSSPDVIVATSDPVLAQLHRLSSTIPIVFTQISEPVRNRSRCQPCATGWQYDRVSEFRTGDRGKWLEVLKEIAPNLKRVGALSMPDAKPHASFLDAAQRVAPSVGIAVTVVDIRNDIERAIVSYNDQPNSGLIVFPHPKTIANRKLISSLAARSSIAGGLSVSILFSRRGSDLVWSGSDRSMAWGCELREPYPQGEKPEGLPIQTPTKYELAINLKTAKALG